jgi:hypothetical protein
VSYGFIVRFSDLWHSQCNHNQALRVKIKKHDPSGAQAMNRITSQAPNCESQAQGHPALRAERKLQRDVETMLRDIAFVLKMTRRVKAEILAEQSSNETLAV